MGFIKNLLYYPVIIMFDILEFFYRIIGNIRFKFKKKNYDYDDIVKLEYTACFLPDFIGIDVYISEVYQKKEREEHKEVGISLEEFKKLKEILRKNKAFKYHNIFSFSITPFGELFVEDGGSGEEYLTIYLKEGKEHKINVYRASKWFDGFVEMLHEL